MAIDEVPVQPEPTKKTHGSSTLTWVVIIVGFVIFAVVAGFTLDRVGTLQQQLTATQMQLRDVNAQLRDQVATRLSSIEQQNAQQLESVKAELDNAAKRVGAQGGELKRARNMVTQLQDQQRQQGEQFKQQLDQKADQQQVGALTQDVNSTKSDLNNTKNTVNTIANDLGMARSEMGTLIARNHDDIEYLRKQGERDYFEFTLAKGKPAKVAGVGLTLKKTNVKRYRFNVTTLADDLAVERRDCTINAPVFFYTSGSKQPYELVVNHVEAEQVKGYISTPKGVTQVAASAQGSH